MKLTTIATFGLASLAAASPVLNKEENNDVNKRDESSPELNKRFWGWPFGPFNPFDPFAPATTSTKSKSKPTPTPAPTAAPAPAWPKFNNGTAWSTAWSSSYSFSYTTSIPKTTVLTTSSSSVTKKTSSTKAPASKTTPTPSKPTSQPPSPTSPEGIVSSIASDVNGLINGIWHDINGIIGSIGLDIGSIFGDDNDFPFFKRELEAAIKKRGLEDDIKQGSATAEEIEAALGKLVTNVFGHLISLTNGTSVSLAQSLLTALDL